MVLAGSEARIGVLIAGVESEEEAREILEDVGILVNDTVTARGKVIIININKELTTLGDPVRVETDNGTYILAYKDVDCPLMNTINSPIQGVVHGTRLALASQICLKLCGETEARLGDYIVRARQEAGDLVHACLFNPTTGEWREGTVHADDLNDIKSILGIGEGLAVELANLLRRLVSPFRQVQCLKWLVGNEEYCLESLTIREVNNGQVELWLERERRGGLERVFLARLPADVRIIHDEFLGQEFYTVYINDRLIIVSSDINDFANALKNRGFIIERLDREVQLAIEALAKRMKGYLMPGITDDGIVDPYGELDLNDYGVEGLVKAYEWVVKYYPEENRVRALANIALLIAKIVSPIVRKHNKTFVDFVVWNYGRGGEGKTTLVEYVLTPLLGVGGINEYVVIKGPVKRDTQFRNLVSLHRLPLILDEQDLKSLRENAGMIIATAVGMGTIGIHASKYGLGIGARFVNMRGVIVNTNVTFPAFLHEAISNTSDVALARRVLVINWSHESVDPTAFDDLPVVKPIMGAVNNVFRKYKSELMSSSDLIDLAVKIMVALAREYARADNERVVIEDYVKALENVRSEYEVEKPQLLEDDAEEFRNASYEFARKLGIQVRSWMDVVDALLNNSPQSGVELHGARYADETTAIQERVLKLLGVGPNEDFLTSPRVPSSIARALSEGRVKVYVRANALGVVPGGWRQWLGKTGTPYRGRRYYVLDLDEFLRVFVEGDEASREASGSNGELNEAS
ncbi:hypothetical protein Vsou_13660 [Vulcanisaeta souniana JCM 11219]|uniref:Uncharacterized protein n=2 Tax=Vulcanisaeta souniana TaxID=164452 RepID=A0ABN6SS79_9CREN|nr:hypothetical protein Vsou_13660 [Vulcanisaeta souniana JCM 11219]